MRIDFQNGKLITNTPLPKIEPPGRKLKNWLATYGEYTAENEAPEAFHMAVGLGTIAGASQRKVYMTNEFFETLTNMFIVLVAPPGTARKTTALKIGRNLLKEVPGIHFSTKASSPAALIKQMADLPNKEHQSLTCYAYELGTLLSSNTNEMVDILTDLYDGNPDWDKQTIGRGMEKITRPWLNLLAGTTPQWLGDYLSPTAVEGGLVSRSIFVYHDKRKLSNPIPKTSPEQRKLRELLVNDLTHISTLSGEFRLDPDADSLYDAWYKDEKRFPQIIDTRTGGYFERKHIHVLKIAMAFALAESDELVLYTHHIEMALEFLEGCEPGMKRSFSSVGRNIFATDLERVLAQIDNRGSMEYGEIVAANYHAIQTKDLDQILTDLVNMGKAKRENGSRYVSKNGRH